MSQDGSTLTELLVAATITLLAIGMVAGSLLPSLRSLTLSVEQDRRAPQLDLAADVFARTVRAARPSLTEPAVRLESDTTLLVRLGPGPDDVLELALVPGRLELRVADDVNDGRFPSAVDLDGFAPDGGRFVLLDTAGQVLHGEAGWAVGGVVLELARDGERIERIERLRMMEPLAGPVRR